MKEKNLKNILLSFIKIGVIGFGGGSALIPVIEKEIVKNNNYIDENEYLKHTIIANITPGTLPTKLSALCSLRYSIAAAYGSTLPGVLMTLFLMTVFSLIGEKAITYIEYASIGISTFIILLLVQYIKKVILSGKHTGYNRVYLIIIFTASIITGGKETKQILSLILNKNTEAFFFFPMLNISTINLMFVTFFIICFIGKNASKLKWIICLLISVIYIFQSDSALFIGNIPLLNSLSPVLMTLLAIWSIVYDHNKNKGKKIKAKTKIDINIIKAIVLYLLIPLILIIICFTAYPGFIGDMYSQTSGIQSLTKYIINTVVSTLTSFGGGEAYISVADGFFVQSGFIAAKDYYNQVVAVANALPGPILVKVAASVGYNFGVSSTGSLFWGWMIAMIGTALTIGASSIAALVVLAGFENLKGSHRLEVIIKYILPVICGMLISTCLSIVYESMKIFQHHIPYANAGFGILAVTFLLAFMLFLHKRFLIRDIYLLFISVALSLMFFVII